MTNIEKLNEIADIESCDISDALKESLISDLNEEKENWKVYNSSEEAMEDILGRDWEQCGK